jgi:hypothetical protein
MTDNDFQHRIPGHALSIIVALLITSKTKRLKGMSSSNLKDHLIIFTLPVVPKSYIINYRNITII